MENPENIDTNILYPEIAKEIAEMVNQDQEMREKSLADASLWDGAVDIKNSERMAEIISKIGWPTYSKVGKEGVHDAWLLIQHADKDVDLQEFCVELMKQAPENEVDKKDVAHLEDRIRVNKKLPQIYGTQFNEIEGKLIPRDIEDPENVDARRISMGLGTLEEGIQEMHRKYGLPYP